MEKLKSFKGDKTWQEYTLEELLPLGFSMTKTGQE